MAETLGCIVFDIVGGFIVGGWYQHLVSCLMQNRWGFLIAGAIFFPVAIVHGWGIWLGWWR